MRDRVFSDRGVTFAFSGEEERPFPLDLVPARSSPRPSGRSIERGVAQRVLALERFLADVYGAGEILRDRVVPAPARRHVEALPPRGRRRRAAGRRARARRRHRPRPRRRRQAPRARGQRAHPVRHLVRRREPARDDARVPRAVRVAPRPPGCRLSVAAARGAARDRADRRVGSDRRACSRPACTTPRTSSTRSSPARWASSSSRAATSCAATTACTCARPRATSRCTSCTAASTTSTSTRCTSAATRCSAARGCVNAARAGNVAIANFVGNGVADDKAIYPYVPAMIDYYLGERPVLDNVETYDLADADVRAWALDRLDQLVWKPVDGSGGHGLVIGPARRRRGACRRSRVAVVDRSAWRGSRRCRSRCRPRRPTSTARWAPRHLDLRPFALHDGERVWVVPGG